MMVAARQSPLSSDNSYKGNIVNVVMWNQMFEVVLHRVVRRQFFSSLSIEIHQPMPITSVRLS